MAARADRVSALGLIAPQDRLLLVPRSADGVPTVEIARG